MIFKLLTARYISTQFAANTRFTSPDAVPIDAGSGMQGNVNKAVCSKSNIVVKKRRKLQKNRTYRVKIWPLAVGRRAFAALMNKKETEARLTLDLQPGLHIGTCNACGLWSDCCNSNSNSNRIRICKTNWINHWNSCRTNKINSSLRVRSTEQATGHVWPP